MIVHLLPVALKAPLTQDCKRCAHLSKSHAVLTTLYCTVNGVYAWLKILPMVHALSLSKFLNVQLICVRASICAQSAKVALLTMWSVTYTMAVAFSATWLYSILSYWQYALHFAEHLCTSDGLKATGLLRSRALSLSTVLSHHTPLDLGCKLQESKDCMLCVLWVCISKGTD